MGRNIYRNINWDFTIEEINLMCFFDTSSRAALIKDLRDIIPDFNTRELKDLAESLLWRLERTSDEDFAELGLYPEYGEYENDNYSKEEESLNGIH